MGNISIEGVDKDIKELALAFVKEAKYDLELAKIVLKHVDATYKESSEEILYINRRVLYLLQQASEKILKAYIMTFFVVWARFIVNVVGELDRNKFPRIYRFHEAFKQIAKLTPQQVKHSVQRGFFNIVKNLYDLVCIHRGETEQYLRLFLDRLDRLIEMLKSRVFAIPYLTDKEKNNIVEVLRLLMKHMKKDILTQFSSIKCNVQVELNEKALSKPLQPPCLAQTLKMYLDSKNHIDNTSRRLEPTLIEIVESAVSKYISPIVGILNQFMKVDVEHIDVSINRVIKALTNPRIYLYPVAFLPLYMCLHWYESGGRYPDKVAEIGHDKVRKDVAFVKNVADAVDELVNLLGNAINTLYGNTLSEH